MMIQRRMFVITVNCNDKSSSFEYVQYPSCHRFIVSNGTCFQVLGLRIFDEYQQASRGGLQDRQNRLGGQGVAM